MKEQDLFILKMLSIMWLEAIVIV
ncbi:unknown protein [Parachlamydia acanthamoebae UV-7]|uniref:Uncharacterized protein n=1 Tax=Parachlamydia acanthamoebae (strain UV7) TaxID=765952 RepID=F8L1E2_PARAV|nr:unknown protein [Parachlamydia acanthamoebae UV-7]